MKLNYPISRHSTGLLRDLENRENSGNLKICQKRKEKILGNLKIMLGNLEISRI